MCICNMYIRASSMSVRNTYKFCEKHRSLEFSSEPREHTSMTIIITSSSSKCMRYEMNLYNLVWYYTIHYIYTVLYILAIISHHHLLAYQMPTWIYILISLYINPKKKNFFSLYNFLCFQFNPNTKVLCSFHHGSRT